MSLVSQLQWKTVLVPHDGSSAGAPAPEYETQETTRTQKTRGTKPIDPLESARLAISNVGEAWTGVIPSEAGILARRACRERPQGEIPRRFAALKSQDDTPHPARGVYPGRSRRALHPLPRERGGILNVSPLPGGEGTRQPRAGEGSFSCFAGVQRVGT